MLTFQTFCGKSACAISKLSIVIGQSVSWLILLMALVTTLIVAARTIFNTGTVGTQESLTYMHALVIMLASAYTVTLDGHVRVDIFYRRFNTEQKAWVNALGCALFLLPLSLFTMAISWDYVMSSWSVMETSADAGGIPAVYLLKSLLLIAGLLLALQALAEIARNLIPLTFLDSPANADKIND